MAKLRQIDTHFWRDNYVATLNERQTYAFNYFLTNPEMTMCGVYELPMRTIVFDTKMQRSKVLPIIEKFQTDNKVFYNDPWIVIVNRPKYLKKLSRNHWVGIVNELNRIPLELIPQIPKAFWEGYQSLINDLAKPSNTLPFPFPFPSPSPFPLVLPPLKKDFQQEQPERGRKKDRYPDYNHPNRGNPFAGKEI